jgi:hypothetical protein
LYEIDNLTQKSFNWIARPSQDITTNPVFYLELYDTEAGNTASFANGTIIQSHYFNITDPSTSTPTPPSSTTVPTHLSLSTITPSFTTPSPSTTLATMTTPASLGAATTSAGGTSGSGGSSNKVAIGAGVGIGLSVALLVFSGAISFIRRQKEEEEEEEAAISPLKAPSRQHYPEKNRQEHSASCLDGNVKNRTLELSS